MRGVIAGWRNDDKEKMAKRNLKAET